MLKEQHSRAEAIKDASGEKPWQLPDPGDKEANELKCSARSHAQKQGLKLQMLEAALAAVTMRHWSLGFREEGVEQKASSQP